MIAEEPEDAQAWNWMVLTLMQQMNEAQLPAKLRLAIHDNIKLIEKLQKNYFVRNMLKETL